MNNLFIKKKNLKPHSTVQLICTSLWVSRFCIPRFFPTRFGNVLCLVAMNPWRLYTVAWCMMGECKITLHAAGSRSNMLRQDSVPAAFQRGLKGGLVSTKHIIMLTNLYLVRLLCVCNMGAAGGQENV